MPGGRPVPRDLAFFLVSEVFPSLPRGLVEEALSCASVVYIPEGGSEELHGLVVVYGGAVRVGDAVYERGDYFLADGPVHGERDSVLIVFPRDCGRLLEAGLREAEACSVGGLVHRDPVCVEPGTPCIEAVRVMARHGVSSVLVCSGGRAVAIFTDTDLRRVVAVNGSVPPVAVEECGTRDPVGVEETASCAEAVRVMMERYVKHLVVYSGGRVRGVVTVRDIAYAEALGPLYAMRLVSRAEGALGLREAYPRLLRLLRRGLARLQPAAEPRRAEHYARMASLALRSVVERAAAIAAREAGLPGEGWAYLVSGSLARQEQPLPTDRDTMLLYDPARVQRRALQGFAERVEALLDELGYPGCSHGHTSLRHLYSLGEARERLAAAAAEPTRDENIVLLGLAMDAVAVWPRGSGLGDWLRARALEAVREAGSGPSVRAAMAAYRPRLGPLRRLPASLDLKRDALAPIVYAAKALAAAAGGWRPVNTADRLLELAAAGALPSDLAEDALQAYQVVLGYTAWAMAVHGGRRLDTRGLTGYERTVLREALAAAARLVDRARSPA